MRNSNVQSPSSIIGFIRTIALVSVVTMLVWVWAEGESLRDEKASMRVEFVNPPDADLVFLPTDGAASTLVVTANGSGAGVPTGSIVWSVPLLGTLEGATDAVARADAEAEQKVIRLGAGVQGLPLQAGVSQTVNLLGVLREHPDARRFASVLVGVEPQALTVDAVRMVSRELPVRADPVAGLETDGDPTPARSTVTIRLPESLAARLNDESVARLTIDESELPRLREEGVRAISVKVRPPAEIEAELASAQAGPYTARLVRMLPDSMGVTVRVRRSVETVTLRSVPVWPSVAPDQFNLWEITLLDQFLTDVTLSGSREAIQRVQSGAWPVKATVELSWEDLERAIAGAAPTAPGSGAAGTTTKQAVISSLPPGVSASVQNSTIRVRVERRSSGNGENEDEMGGRSVLPDPGDSPR